MAKVKYDVEDVETGGGGEQPEPGLYDGQIVDINHRKKKGDNTAISDFEVIVSVGDQYARLWYYVKLPDDPNWSKEKHGWKLREFTDALGLAPKGDLDPVVIKKQKPLVKAKVVSDTDLDGGYRGKVKNLFAPGEGATAPASGGGSAPAGEDEPWTEEELLALSDAELKAEVEGFELTDVKTAGRGWKPKAIAAILEAQEPEAGGEAGSEETDGGNDGNSALLVGLPDEVIADIVADPEHYADWSDEDLSAFITEDLAMGEQIKTAGRGWRAKAVAALVEFAETALGGDGVGDGPLETGEDPLEDDYDEAETWPDSDLKEEIEERNEKGAEIAITGRWTRAKMIAALREDNKNAEPF